MRIDVLTIFPEMFKGPLSESILKRAQEKGIIAIHLHNIRDFAEDKHRVTDDYPFGGGVGMLMKPEPLFKGVEHVKQEVSAFGLEEPHVILMCPQGRTFDQDIARELAARPALLFVCGHYEGVDERVREHLVDDEISIGDYVLTGGELPAMVVIDAVARMIPGVLKEEESAVEDSFYNYLLDFPQYTRPRDFRGMKVPEVLLSGDHEKVRLWRRKEALRRTLLRRPDLLRRADLDPADLKLLKEIEEENCIGPSNVI
ncbi:MAG: tRNA (guanosine(37)-N1)-methyltransferase TrmD [Firmicutes bacterium]|nr:tRNA (guanosine(37)-N1)-methyltransferase TrmD [Bacillota bacterium]